MSSSTTRASPSRRTPLCAPSAARTNVDYAVVKNTLLRFAFNNVGLNELDEQLNGTTALAVCADDPVAPARVIADYAKKLNGKFEIKGGFMDGKVVDMATINALAAIPALPVLQAQVLGTMLAPITSLACVLKQIAEKDGAPAEAADSRCRVELRHPANKTNNNLTIRRLIKMSEKITAMIEEIKGLTVLELSELVHALEEEFGVSAAAMAAPAAGAAAPAAEEKTEFDVILDRLRRRSEDQGHQGRPRGHPVWAWPRPRALSSPLPRPSRKASPRTMPRPSRSSSRKPARRSRSSNFTQPFEKSSSSQELLLF